MTRSKEILLKLLTTDSKKEPLIAENKTPKQTMNESLFYIIEVPEKPGKKFTASQISRAQQFLDKAGEILGQTFKIERS